VIRSTYIIIAVGFAIIGYLILDRGNTGSSSSSIANRIKTLPVIESIPFHPITLDVRNPFMTQAVWAEYVRSQKPTTYTTNTSQLALKGGSPLDPKHQKNSGKAAKPVAIASTPPPVLSGILIGESGRTAILNGEVLGEGTKKKGLTLKKIDLDRVLVLSGDKLLEIRQPLMPIRRHFAKTVAPVASLPKSSAPPPREQEVGGACPKTPTP